VLKLHSKAPRGLVALGSAAIIGVYGAGYARTRTAGSRFAETPAIRRPADPAAVAPTATTTRATPPANTAAIKMPPPPVRSEARREGKRWTEPPVVDQAPKRTSARTTEPTAAAPVQAATPAPALTTSEPAPMTAGHPATVVVKDAALADAAAASAPDAPAPAQGAYRDGTYSGWGSSRHGDIQATVVILEGRIAGASITQCLTRYPCNLIAHLPAQVIARQSADVDYVTGATQSADAFYYAVLDALSKAK
jgi:uncharacterized protein with FMN-binding domain